MAFLYRRPSRPRLPLFPSESTPNSTDKQRSPSALIRRVSTIFSPRKKQIHPPRSQPLSNTPLSPRRRRSRSSDRTPSTTSSDDDIRPPSGLGFSVAIFDPLASNISLPSPPGERIAMNDVPERLRCISSPMVLRSNTVVREQPPDNTLRPPIAIPPEVLDVILSFLPRQIITSLAAVSKKFCAAVRRKLYEKLDLSALCNLQLQKVSRLLASRWDLADMVHTLICDSWPPSETSPSASRPSLSFLSLQVPTFSVALHNMHHLTTLTLPSFDSAILRDRTNFRLKSLTLLTNTMSPDHQIELFAWLSTQPDITSLSFPNLVEPANVNKDLPLIPNLDQHNTLGMDPPDTHADHNSTQTFHDPFIPTIHPNTLRFDHLSLLPALTSLHGPPTLSTLLAPTRSLKDITIHIRSNLDTGLRPSALMAAIRGVTTLGICFASNVDKRSVEKVLRAAAAAALGDVCQSLDVQVGWLVSDESLYKIAHAVLLRFGVLQTLRFRRTVDPASAPSSPRRDNHHRNDVSTRPKPPLGSDESESEDGGGREDEDESVHLEVWLKHCPDLRFVKFLSGAVWHGGVP